MASPFATEFTPELSKEYLASLLNPIDEQERSAIGNARQEGAAAGLIGQAATGSRIGAVEAGADRSRTDTIAKFNENVAGSERSERLTAEKEAYDSTEAQKDRDFRKSLTEMGYQFSDQEREAQRKSDSDFNAPGFFAGLGSTALSSGIGGYFGGLGRKADK